MPKCGKCLFDPRTGKECVRLIDIHPDIAEEYSLKNKIPIDKISIESKVRISWICRLCKGAFCGKIEQKLSNKIKCSRCFPTIGTPLFQSHPQLAAIWSLNNTLLPENLSSGSEQKIWLICQKEDCRKEYDTRVCIAASGSRCPYCSGRRVAENTNLAYLRPDLASQWSALNKKTPSEVTQFSHYKACWNCSQCSNVWQAAVAKRSGGNGCPNCRVSKGEAAIAKLLNSKGISFEQEKTFVDCKNQNALLFDFYLYNYNICIEYDGQQHFMPIKDWGGEEKFKQRQMTK